MTLMAAFLPMMGCVAEYTEPMPPSATLPLMTYSPTCVPSARSVPVASAAPSPIISFYHGMVASPQASEKIRLRPVSTEDRGTGQPALDAERGRPSGGGAASGSRRRREAAVLVSQAATASASSVSGARYNGAMRGVGRVEGE